MLVIFIFLAVVDYPGGVTQVNIPSKKVIKTWKSCKGKVLWYTTCTFFRNNKRKEKHCSQTVFLWVRKLYLINSLHYFVQQEIYFYFRKLNQSEELPNPHNFVLLSECWGAKMVLTSQGSCFVISSSVQVVWSFLKHSLICLKGFLKSSRTS